MVVVSWKKRGNLGLLYLDCSSIASDFSRLGNWLTARRNTALEGRKVTLRRMCDIVWSVPSGLISAA